MFVPKGPINNFSSFDSDNGLAPNRRQAIIWTNDDIVFWRIYASLGLNEWNHSLTAVNMYFMVSIPFSWIHNFNASGTRSNDYAIICAIYASICVMICLIICWISTTGLLLQMADVTKLWRIIVVSLNKRVKTHLSYLSLLFDLRYRLYSPWSNTNVKHLTARRNEK